jgi:hypothetical protein
MTTGNNIGRSLEKIFLSDTNIRDISAYIGRNAREEMKEWASTRKLDDYESVQMDYIEALDFANAEFSKKHKHGGYELNMSAGQDYPKYYIDEGVERYTVDDFRKHDAQSTQEVMRSNSNFRYGNKIKQWNIGQHRRHYDRDEHENGFGDIRELNTIERSYNMDKIYGPNDYESAESTMYDY